MKGKYIVPLILASVSATAFGAHAQFSVKADFEYSDQTVLNGDLIQISGFKGEGQVGTPITLPTATVVGGSDAKVTVTDPRGKVVAVTGNQFTPKLKGYYTVKYSTTTTNNTKVESFTEELKINVKGSEYSIVLPTNSQHVIPATVKTNTTVKIPMPTVNENGEAMAQADFISSAAATGLKVFVVNKDATDQANSEPLAFDSETKTYSFTPTTAGVYEIIYRYYNGGVVQDYKTDSFVAKNNYKGEDIKLNFSWKTSKPTTATLGVETSLPEVKVFDENNSSVELEAYVSIGVKHIDSNTEYTVKDYKFTPNQKGKYRVTYKVSIPLFGIESESASFIIEDVKDNVQPTVKAVNNYEYTTDSNGKTTITKVYKDANKDNEISAGEVLYDAAKYVGAKEEDREEALNKALSETVYDIPSVVYLKTNPTTERDEATIKVPAIYSTDNASDYSKIKFKRFVKDDGGLLNEITKVDGTISNPYPANEWAEYTFTDEGNYTIRYEATDEAGNTFMQSYDIKVLSSDAELKDENKNYLLPTVNFPAISSYVRKDGTLTIEQPTATDKYDTRVETRVYYSTDGVLANATQITETNESGKYVLNLEKLSLSVDKIYIHAVAYNDYAGVPQEIKREVSLIDTTDNGMPTFVDVNNFFTGMATKNWGSATTKVIDENGFVLEDGKKVPAFNQKDTVQLPDFEITDVKDTNLNISVVVKDPYGKPVRVKNSTYSKDVAYDAQGNITNNTYVVKDGSFTVDYSGIYTITYTAKDAGGNIVAKTYGVRVKDTSKPAITLSGNPPTTVELGKFVEIPAATLTDNGELLTNITTNVPFESKKVDPENSSKFIPGTYWELVEGPSLNTMGTVGFTPTIAGDYVIKYYGWDATGNATESKTYTITVTDSIKPTIKLENDLILTNIAWDEEGDNWVYAPGIVELYDGYRDKENSENDYDQTSVNDITLTVKIYDRNNDEVSYEEEEVLTGEIYTTRYKFKALTQGVYTIKYTATDAEGNLTEQTKEVHVGDTDAAEVEWVNSEEDLISSASINSSYEFNLDMITIDGIKGTEAIKVPTGETAAEYTVTVNMYSPSSSIVTNEYKNDSSKQNSYKWTFNNSGRYELRIVVKDKAGNTETASYNIVVAANEANEEKVNNVVGTILIVVSALILVGVVVYFVITGRNKTNKKGPKAKNKK